jgi:hypothetical protein
MCGVGRFCVWLCVGGKVCTSEFFLFLFFLLIDRLLIRLCVLFGPASLLLFLACEACSCCVCEREGASKSCYTIRYTINRASKSCNTEMPLFSGITAEWCLSSFIYSIHVHHVFCLGFPIPTTNNPTTPYTHSNKTILRQTQLFERMVSGQRLILESLS